MSQRIEWENVSHLVHNPSSISIDGTPWAMLRSSDEKDTPHFVTLQPSA